MRWIAIALLTLLTVMGVAFAQSPAPAPPTTASTYTTVSAQYRSGIDTGIDVSPNEPLRVEIWMSSTAGVTVTVPFHSGMTRRDIANAVADTVRELFPDRASDVSVHGATVIIKNTSPKTKGTPSKPQESSTNHNRPYLSSSTKTI